MGNIGVNIVIQEDKKGEIMKIQLPKKLECKRCGHQWIPRTDDVRQCPKCKSAHWDKEKK